MRGTVHFVWSYLDAILFVVIGAYYRQSWVGWWQSHPERAVVNLSDPGDLAKWSAVAENVREAINFGLFTASILFPVLMLILQVVGSNGTAEGRERAYRTAIVGMVAYCVSILVGLLNMWTMSLNPDVIDAKRFVHADDAVITLLTAQYALLGLGAVRTFMVGAGLGGTRSRGSAPEQTKTASGG